MKDNLKKIMIGIVGALIIHYVFKYFNIFQ